MRDDLKSLLNDPRATSKDPPAKNYKHNHNTKEIKHPETRSDIVSMKHKELFAWSKFHDIRTGKGKRNERFNKEELLALAARTWNAVPNDDLDISRKTLQLDKVPLKVPQTWEISGSCDSKTLCNGSDLKEWQLRKEYEKGQSAGSRP